MKQRTKVLRDTVRAILKAGGSNVEIRHGGKHTLVSFVDLNGAARRIAVHIGTRDSFRAEARLRSQIRNGTDR
jgi:hypothetical protein